MKNLLDWWLSLAFFLFLRRLSMVEGSVTYVGSRRSFFSSDRRLSSGSFFWFFKNVPIFNQIWLKIVLILSNFWWKFITNLDFFFECDVLREIFHTKFHRVMSQQVERLKTKDLKIIARITLARYAECEKKMPEGRTDGIESERSAVCCFWLLTSICFLTYRLKKKVESPKSKQARERRLVRKEKNE